MTGEVTTEDEVVGKEPVYRTYHDMTEDGLSVTIVEALARVKGVDPVEVIDDYSEYVDPDALDHLFRVRPGEDNRHEGGFLHLEIRGVSVTVHPDGEINIAP